MLIIATSNGVLQEKHSAAFFQERGQCRDAAAFSPAQPLTNAAPDGAKRGPEEISMIDAVTEKPPPGAYFFCM
jgi:hypothetical protein